MGEHLNVCFTEAFHPWKCRTFPFSQDSWFPRIFPSGNWHIWIKYIMSLQASSVSSNSVHTRPESWLWKLYLETTQCYLSLHEIPHPHQSVENSPQEDLVSGQLSKLLGNLRQRCDHIQGFKNSVMSLGHSLALVFMRRNCRVESFQRKSESSDANTSFSFTLVSWDWEPFQFPHLGWEVGILRVYFSPA